MAKFYPLKVKEVRKETADCRSVSFDIPEELSKEFKFTQGQYLTLRTEIDGEEVRRSYSLCTSPLDGDLRVAIKEVPGGLFSTFANRELKAGDVLEAMPPMGNFFSELKPENEKNYVAFAAGSGITPIISILKTVMEIEPKSTFTLFYGNKYASSVIFKEEIEGLKNSFFQRVRVFHFFSREIPDIDLFHGRLDKGKCEALFKGIIDPRNIDEYFLCGPEEMIFSVKEALEEVGVESKKVHFELFTTGNGKKKKVRVQREENKDKVCEVFIKDGGNSFGFNLPFDTESILDAALARGADLPFACKGGVCCTCKAKITEGEVEMEVNYALEPEEVEAGYVLACQAFPKSPKVVIDFDEAL
ncbi:MAG: phenylacetate-CoA oxygenase/reductase subunit PaaK [Bacteroidia bacterium]|nr:phenylacetate-CoA oxygenase/reductase subunit PaaK [Bacteroidia bacterium]